MGPDGVDVRCATTARASIPRVPPTASASSACASASSSPAAGSRCGPAPGAGHDRTGAHPALLERGARCAPPARPPDVASGHRQRHGARAGSVTARRSIWNSSSGAACLTIVAAAPRPWAWRSSAGEGSSASTTARVSGDSLSRRGSRTSPPSPSSAGSSSRRLGRRSRSSVSAVAASGACATTAKPGSTSMRSVRARRTRSCRSATTTVIPRPPSPARVLHRSNVRPRRALPSVPRLSSECGLFRIAAYYVRIASVWHGRALHRRAPIVPGQWPTRRRRTGPPPTKCASCSPTTTRSSAPGLRLLLEAEPGFEVVAEAGDVEGAVRYTRGHKPRRARARPEHAGRQDVARGDAGHHGGISEHERRHPDDAGRPGLRPQRAAGRRARATCSRRRLTTS